MAIPGEDKKRAYLNGINVILQAASVPPVTDFSQLPGILRVAALMRLE
jgi:hypothetical protein